MLQSQIEIPKSQIRRRGGQPGNLNALRHGLYSSRRPRLPAFLFDHRASISDPPIPLSPITIPQTTNVPIPNVRIPNLRFPKLQPTNRPLTISRISDLQSQITLNRLFLSRLFELSTQAADLRGELACYHAISRLMGSITSTARACRRERQAHEFLPRLAHHAPALVAAEFCLRRIPPRPVQSSASLPLDAQNLGRVPRRGEGGRKLHRQLVTDSQWNSISETFVSLRADLDAFRAYRRRKPPPDPRPLFEAILLKLAFGLRWQDVPILVSSPKGSHLGDREAPRSAAKGGGEGAFSLRAAQTLYRRLYRSGRMQGIYEALSAHLAVHGGTTPEQMVSQGAFVVARDRIALAPGWPLTWQTFTALLLLQRAFHNQRSLSREAVAGRRRQGRYLRLPSRRQRNLHFSNSPFSRYPSTNSPILYSSILQSPPFTFSLTPALRPPTPAIRSSTLTQKQQECGPVLESFHGSPVLECSNSPPPPARIIMK